MNSTDHVVLVGMMGAGKSTVGALVAARLGRSFVDTDHLVEATAGKRVAELFADDGEPTFRRLESAALRAAIASPAPQVIAVGGGAVLEEANRALLRRAGTVCWLRARDATVLARIGGGADRPLLAPSPAAVLPGIAAAREPLYAAVADVVVDVDETTPTGVGERVTSALVRRVPVELGAHRYDVHVGPGARRVLASALPARARRAVVVTQEGIGVDVEPGIDTVRVTIGDGEAAKSLHTIEQLCRSFARAGVTRHDVVVAVGGGVVTDAAGFAASCYHRGLDVIHVSTTLLGQVDASIGGKTGVNLPEGKNLVGAFWQPHAVICDTDTLVTLPEREWRSGFGEMAKYAFLGVEELDRLGLAEQILRCAALKAAVVAEDEREGGRRMLLNYGHTLAHALEATGFAADTGEAGSDAGSRRRGEPLRHGEAVGIGLVFAARLAELLGRIDASRVARHVELVAGYGLPTAVPRDAPAAELVTLMGRDKKATAGLTFVLDGPNGCEVVAGLRREMVDEALERSREGGR